MNRPSPASPAAVFVLGLALTACDGLVDISGQGMTFSAISAGAAHTCGVAGNGELYCWGDGALGQLGDGLAITGWVPVRVPLSHAVLAVSTGQGFTCAITVDQRLWCWGWSAFGQLGIGNAPGQGLPAAVDPERDYAAISSGWHHSCALTVEGAAYCWGRNDQGQLGTGDVVGASVPVPAANGLRFRSIAAGAHHTCGLTLEHEVYCWGLNQYGQLGDGTSVSSLEPVRLALAQPLSAVAAGYAHSCGVAQAGGQLYCWGSSVHGELGVGLFTPLGTPGSVVPVAVPGVLDVRDVSAGHYVTCTIMGVRPLCFGRGEFGQLGLGTRGDHSRAQYIGELDHQFSGISVGGTHSCAVSLARAGYCWGEGPSGQLGTGALMALVPVRVFGSVR